MNQSLARRVLGYWQSRPERALEQAKNALEREEWSKAAKYWKRVLRTELGNSSSEATACLIRSRRNAGYLRSATSIVQSGLLKHPRDVRLLAERAVLDNYIDVKHEGLKGISSAHVEIIVCVHNALDKTRRCLHSLEARCPLNQAITIVDDASSPEVSNVLNSFVAKSVSRRLITNETNLGYTKSANLGLRSGRREWLLLLNSDTVVTNGWLDGLVRCVASNPEVRAAGPLSNAATFQSLPWAAGLIRDEGNPSSRELDEIANRLRALSRRTFPRVPMLNGFCLLLHKPTLDETGYLDEINFPRGYGEENDLCLRLILAGHKLAIADDVFVYHSRSASFGSDLRRKLTAKAMETLRRLWPGYSYTYIWNTLDDIPALRSVKKVTKFDCVDKTSF